MPDQISFKELLQDPLFKAWTMKPPKLNSVAIGSQPWYVYVKREGRWGRKEFPSYAKAFNWLAMKLKADEVQDAAIHCKRQWFPPPLLRASGKKTFWPMPPGHRWCGLCRRPIVLAYFSRHHAFPKHVHPAPYELRCPICGARAAMAPREYPSKLRSRFA